MKKIKKIVMFMVLLLQISVMCVWPVMVEGSVYDNNETHYNVKCENYASDVIVIKTRIYKGKYQYRRWNETKRRWVDSKWRNI
ncbi:MAG: hypothetical protein ACLR5B_04495 [Blautia sp.]